VCVCAGAQCSQTHPCLQAGVGGPSHPRRADACKLNHSFCVWGNPAVLLTSSRQLAQCGWWRQRATPPHPTGVAEEVDVNDVGVDGGAAAEVACVCAPCVRLATRESICIAPRPHWAQTQIHTLGSCRTQWVPMTADSVAGGCQG
jgi:hypothetical protein